LAKPTFTQFFGKTFTDSLHTPVLTIGKDTWDREQLAEIGVTHVGGARLVSELASEYKAKDTRDLYHKLSARALAKERGLGLVCLFVLWRAFEAKGLDTVDWYTSGREGAIVTFLTVKRQEVLTAKRSKRKSGGRQEFKPTGPGKPLTFDEGKRKKAS
jgi:hypothetical protein